MKIVVLQHVDCETAGAYLPLLEKSGDVEIVDLGLDELPALEAFDAIVAMGGPMGVYDTAAYPWLEDELTALRRALAAGVPIWGVCLGAQLLAAASGATVGLGPQPEVGVDAVTRTSAADHDPVFADLPRELTVLQWHQDTFDLPPGTVLLATGAAYENQAFRIGDSYGLQFHLESPWDLTARWLGLEAYRNSLEASLGDGAADLLRRSLLASEGVMSSLAETLMGRWLEVVTSRPARPN